MKLVVRHWDEYPVNYACQAWERPFWRAVCFVLDNTINRHEYLSEEELRESGY